MSGGLLRARYFLHCLFRRNGYDHAAWLKRHNGFHDMGENCFFQPYNLPADREYIRFGNNVVCASGVSFVCHDVIHHVFNHLPEKKDGAGYNTYWGTIDIRDNVFIGANSTVLADVVIGPNAIVAAGSLVNKDVPEGKIVGGVPARVIGDVEELKRKRKAYSEEALSQMNTRDRLQYLWKGKD